MNCARPAGTVTEKSTVIASGCTVLLPTSAEAPAGCIRKMTFSTTERALVCRPLSEPASRALKSITMRLCFGSSLTVESEAHAKEAIARAKAEALRHARLMFAYPPGRSALTRGAAAEEARKLVVDGGYNLLIRSGRAPVFVCCRAGGLGISESGRSSRTTGGAPAGCLGNTWGGANVGPTGAHGRAVAVADAPAPSLDWEFAKLVFTLAGVR